MKTLMMAAAAALTLGVGTAMAQDGGGGSFPDWQGARAVEMFRQPPGAQPLIPPGPVGQSGSSDVDPTDTGTGADHSATYILNHHLYGAGGVSG
jgi:hypothetical protein